MPTSSHVSTSQTSQGSHSSKIPPLFLKLLQQRGISTDSEIKQFLYPEIGEIADPYALAGMKIAVERIVSAYLEKQKICIYADFDLDGTSGLALLFNGMKALGFEDLIYYQPRRLKEGYGFHAEAAEELNKKNVKLIITVDVGITAVQGIQTAQNLGIDVILTDHHLPKEQLPPAYIIVNPNRPSCPSRLGYLSGAGVAFYLLRALKRAFLVDDRLPTDNFDLKESLEYLTIATITDMVPLVGDNRVLVKMGLKMLEKTKKAGLRACLNELGLSGRPLTSQDVAMRLAPKLNALSRMESNILPIDLFIETDSDRAEEMTSVVMQNNTTRVELQGEAEKEAIESLKNWPHENFVFVFSTRFHRGIIGLIATKLSQTLGKVALVGSLNEEDGMIVGSARTPPGYAGSLVEILAAGSSYLTRFGGHHAAAGFEIDRQHSDRFIGDLKGHFLKSLDDTSSLGTPQKVQFDATIKLTELTPQFMSWYEFLGPYGMAFPIPIFRTTQIEILESRSLRGGHLRLKLREPGSTQLVTALLFSPSLQQTSIIEQYSRDGSLLDIIGEPQWNYFNGQKTIQILIRDIGLFEQGL